MPGVSDLDPDALFAPLEGYDKLGLAVSGGPDSLALMLLLALWAKGRHAPQLFVYTVDHGLRPEAAAEAAMVVREAEALGLPAVSLRWAGEKPGTGIQAAARIARYRLMADAMLADGVAVLVTAHHLADQAETVLMRLAHGSGIEGLRGMDALSHVEGCEVYRPLLGVRPELLRQIVTDAGLAPASDPGNLDEDYERVRWRLMLPALDALGLTLERLGTFAHRMDEAATMIRSEAEAAYAEMVVPVAAEQLSLAHRSFARLAPPVAVMMLGSALRAASADPRPVPLGALELLAKRLRAPEPLKSITLHGCRVSSDGERISIRREGPRKSAARAAGG